MIVNQLLTMFAQALHSLLALLPNVPGIDSSSMAGPAAHIWAWAVWANYYVPLDSATIMLGLVMGAWFAFYGFRFFEWVLSKLHILGAD